MGDPVRQLVHQWMSHLEVHDNSICVTELLAQVYAKPVLLHTLLDPLLGLLGSAQLDPVRIQSVLQVYFQFLAPLHMMHHGAPTPTPVSESDPFYRLFGRPSPLTTASSDLTDDVRHQLIRVETELQHTKEKLTEAEAMLAAFNAFRDETEKFEAKTLVEAAVSQDTLGPIALRLSYNFWRAQVVDAVFADEVSETTTGSIVVAASALLDSRFTLERDNRGVRYVRGALDSAVGVGSDFEEAVRSLARNSILWANDVMCLVGERDTEDGD